MNFLAHSYLSGDNDQVLIGNFIGDWIKGSDYKAYPDDIQKGIIVHRNIDTYTDLHPIVRQSKQRLNEHYHKYSGIIIDIFYDHFLACNWDKYSSVSLSDYTGMLRQSLNTNLHFFPERIQEFVPRFMRRGWIESYATIDGIERVLQGMSKHTSLPDKTLEAMFTLEKYYDGFLNEFTEYFPQLVANIEERFQLGLVIK
jgi:Uncharacterized protein conserved in bacteria